MLCHSIRRLLSVLVLALALCPLLALGQDGLAERKAAGEEPDTLISPLQGNVWKVLVKRGDTVQEGQLLVIIEAMKMENEITAHKAGTISELPISEGAPIQAGATIATITSSS